MVNDAHDRSDRERRLDEVLAHYLRSVEAGTPRDEQSLILQNPDLADDLASFFRNRRAMHQVAEAALDATIETVHPPLAAGHTPPRVRYFGDYELLGEIARGGMGVVYKARQVSLNRPVALKMILSGELASAGDVQRFRAEAEAAANLDHPGIVPIYEVGEHQGQHYFSMKLIEGGSLRERIDGYQRNDRATARLLATVARAVRHAHQRGILHRDLKPGNILVDGDDQPHVTDFGLAKRVEGDSSLTQSGTVLGTPNYMAPEQASAAKQLTTAVDVYSLGAILYELLTGRTPFARGSIAETLSAVLSQEPERPSSIDRRIDRDLETICLKCLEKDPHGRYASADALAEELDRVERGEPILARPVGTMERTRRWCRRRPLVASLIASTAALAVLVLAVSGIGLLVTRGALSRETQHRQFAQRKEREARDAQLVAKRREREAREAQQAAEASRNETAAQRDTAYRNLYVANMWVAKQAADKQETVKLGQLLRAQIPRAGQRDQRGWEWCYFHSLLRRAVLLDQTTNGVAPVAWNPQASQLAMGDLNGTVRVWEAATGANRVVVRGQGKGVGGIAILPDGSALVVAGRDGTVAFRDLRDGRLLNSVSLMNEPIASCAVSSDGKQIAAGGAAGTVSVWSVVEQKVLHRIVHGGRVAGLAWNPNGQEIAAAGGSPGLKVWSAVDGKLRYRLMDGPSEVFSLAWSPSGQRIAMASWDGLRVWDANSRSGVPQFSRIGGPRAVAWNHAGTRLAVAAEDFSVRLLDAMTGIELRALRNLKAYPVQVAWSADDKLIASTALDQIVQVQLVESPPPMRTVAAHQSSCWAVAWSPDGQALATGGQDNCWKLWDLASGNKLFESPRYVSLIRGLSFSPDGGCLAVNAYDRSQAKVWDVLTFRVGSAPSMKCDLPSRGEGGWAVYSRWTRDSRRVFTVDWLGGLRLNDGKSGELLWQIAAHQSRIDGLSLSRDERFLATSGYDNQIQVWFAKSGRRFRTLAERSSAMGVDWHPGGIWLATGGNDGVIRIWDVAEGKLLAGWTGHTAPVIDLAWSFDGRRLASASHDGSLRIWDPLTEKDVLAFHVDNAAPRCLAWSPDGKQLAAGVSDGRALIWDASAGFDRTAPKHPPPRPDESAAARLLVAALHDELMSREAVEAALRSDPTLSAKVRQAAEGLARRLANNDQAISQACWKVVASPGRTPEQYRAALRLAEPLAKSVAPTAEQLNTLGVAQYRTAHYQAAIESLTRSEKASTTRPERSLPLNAAYLALSHHRLGQSRQARDALETLRQLMALTHWATNPEMLAADHEVRWTMVDESYHWIHVASRENYSAGGATLALLEDHSLLASGTNPPFDTYRIVLESEAESLAALRLEVLRDDRLPSGGPGRRPSNGTFVLQSVRALAGPRDGSARAQPVTFSASIADYCQADFSELSLLSPGTGRGWAVWRDALPHTQNQAVILLLAEPLRFQAGLRLEVNLQHQSQFPGANIGRFRLALGRLLPGRMPVSRNDPLLAKPGPALPDRVDLRPRMKGWGLKPKHQGQRDSCSVCVVTSVIEFAYARRNGRGEPLSVEYLNWAANQVVGNQTEERGQFFHDVLSGWTQFGACEEALMPDAASFDPSLTPSGQARQNAKTRPGSAGTVHWIKPWTKSFGLNPILLPEIRRVLSEGYPLAVGSEHSLLLVGYEAHPQFKGGGRFFVSDSATGKFDEVTFQDVLNRMNDIFWIEMRDSPVRIESDP